MKKIYEAAINNADMNVIKNNLITFLNSLEDSPERAVEILLGMETKESELSKKVYDRQNRVLTLKSTNYLKDRVTYSYESKNVYYFKTKEEADLYAKDGTIKDSKWSKNEEYTFESFFTSTKESWCSFDTWMSYSPVE